MLLLVACRGWAAADLTPPSRNHAAATWLPLRPNCSARLAERRSRRSMFRAAPRHRSMRCTGAQQALAVGRSAPLRRCRRGILGVHRCGQVRRSADPPIRRASASARRRGALGKAAGAGAGAAAPRKCEPSAAVGTAAVASADKRAPLQKTSTHFCRSAAALRRVWMDAGRRAAAAAARRHGSTGREWWLIRDRRSAAARLAARRGRRGGAAMEERDRMVYIANLPVPESVDGRSRDCWWQSGQRTVATVGSGELDPITENEEMHFI